MLSFRLSPFQPNQPMKTDIGYRLGYDSLQSALLFFPCRSWHPLNSNVCNDYPSHNYSARCKCNRDDIETWYTCSFTYITAKLRLLSRRLYTYVHLTLPHTWRPLITFIHVIRSADCTESSVQRYTHTPTPFHQITHHRSACSALHCHLDTAPHSHELQLISFWSSITSSNL